MKKIWLKMFGHVTYAYKIVILKAGFAKNTKFKITVK